MRTAKRSDDRAILGPRLALAALAAWAAVLVVGSYASKSPWSVKADTIGNWAAGLWETVASVTGSLTRGITVPRYVSACEELGRVQVVITEQGIDPDYALLSDSTRCGWPFASKVWCRRSPHRSRNGAGLSAGTKQDPSITFLAGSPIRPLLACFWHLLADLLFFWAESAFVLSTPALLQVYGLRDRRLVGSAVAVAVQKPKGGSLGAGPLINLFF